MADESLVELLKASRIFSSLGEEATQRLLNKFSKVELLQEEILFYQGDPSDNVYLLVSGKLSAEVVSFSGEGRLIGHIEPGETVGELGALSDEPRSLSVKALKDSLLLRLTTKDFIAICHQFPSVMFATLQPIITRSKSIIQMISTEKSNKHIVIVPATKEIALEQFAEKLMSFAGNFSSVLTLSDYQDTFKNIDIASVNEKFRQLLQNRKSTHKIIYIVRSIDTPFAKACLKKANTIYMVAQSDLAPKVNKQLIDKIKSRGSHFRSDPVLILLHPDDVSTPKNTSTWLSLTDFSFHHHVRMTVEKDYHRLLRFIRGKAVGLVLSGGGTRGWAHFGVIKALRKAKIPIDIIGGTSAGAMAAACYAMHPSYEEAKETFYKIVVDSKYSISWRSLTWPVVSLFNAKNFTQAQIKAFNDIHIEDMWVPFFCVSCNLTQNTEVVHTRGLLWEKIRASTSIPGIIPPMLINGEIHFDGGLLNNLPVDVMRQFVGDKGKVIAVDLNSYAPHPRHYHFPPILTFKEALFAKFGWGKTKLTFPRFIDTFLRALFVGSLLKSRQNSFAANIFISLDLSKFRLLQSNPDEANSLIEMGYKEAQKHIYKKEVT